MPSIYGTFASLMVIPPERRATGAFCDLLEALLALAATFEQVARPIPAGSLGLRWPPTGLDLMARMRHKSRHLLLMDRIYVGMRTLTAFASLRFGLSIGKFQPKMYLKEVIENSDFRKYYDRLRMTLDCSEAVADRIEVRIADAAQRGVALWPPPPIGRAHDLFQAELLRQTFSLHRRRSRRIRNGGPATRRLQ